MDYNQYFKNLTPPEGKIDIVLDTDAYNEIDDQFAIAYMIKNKEKFNVKGICAAPFYNSLASSPEDGMIKSYNEIIKLLDLANEEELKERVYMGSKTYLADEKTPVESPAADFIVNLANEYSPEKPLYIVAIGAITNVASAILKNPNIKENTVILWLGGHMLDFPGAVTEFNMGQDVAAARIVFGCGAPFVLFPCYGVVDHLTISKFELERWLKGKNPLANYLAENTIKCGGTVADKKPWTRVIWDIAPLFWLSNTGGKYMWDKLIHAPIPEYDKNFAFENSLRSMIRYVYYIQRDIIFEDLFKCLTDGELG